LGTTFTHSLQGLFRVAGDLGPAPFYQTTADQVYQGFLIVRRETFHDIERLLKQRYLCFFHTLPLFRLLCPESSVPDSIMEVKLRGWETGNFTGSTRDSADWDKSGWFATHQEMAIVCAGPWPRNSDTNAAAACQGSRPWTRDSAAATLSGGKVGAMRLL